MEGSRDNAARTWSPGAEVVASQENGEFVEIKLDSKESPCKDTVSKGSLVQPSPFFLLDLVTGGCSVLFDFLKLKHLLVFLGKVTLWKRFRQIHLRALVYWVWLGWR